jgi:hypothetical protein
MGRNQAAKEDARVPADSHLESMACWPIAHGRMSGEEQAFCLF